MNNYNLKRIYVEKNVVGLPVLRHILRELPCVPVEYIDDYRKITIKGNTIDAVYKESKECLAIARRKGELVKQFRCRDGIVGSREYYIIHGNNCLFDCEYCFLQSYFENAVPTLFINHDEMLNAIRDVLISSGNEMLIFHSGELCDALAFDDLTCLSSRLVSLFSEFPDARLELRTKTTTVDNLQNVTGTNNVVVSWTFSPQIVIDNHEHKTPPLEDRINAAHKAQKAGYKIGVCLDPIIRCKNWFSNYESMLNLLFDSLDLSGIKFVSLGGFRFLPSLASIIRERRPQSNLLLGEFVPCVDGKNRYFRPIRVDMYNRLIEIIRRRCDGVNTFLCMETNVVCGEVASDRQIIPCSE